MFIEAIEKILQFTRPLHTISRTYSGLLLPGSATIFFVNEQGVAVTCKHVAQLIINADKMSQQYLQYKVERNRIARDPKYKKNVMGLDVKFHYTKDSFIQMKNNFVNCFDKIENITIHMHQDLDLAILEFKGFNEIRYQSHATFLKDGTQIKQGKYLCRVGFPFPEYNNFRYNESNDDIEWTTEGLNHSPAFPLDGIITRMMATAPGQPFTGIEMSTPGLRGQSGGPLFDTQGLVYGMQYATRHLHLGFDMYDKEIIQDGTRKKISNHPFLHVGQCIHADSIKAFLNQHQVSYREA